MRILLVSEDIPYPNMGGLAKHVLNLARALIQEGHAVDLLGGDQHPLEIAGDEVKFGGRFFSELNGHLAGWKETKLKVYMPYRRTWVAKHFARIIMRHAPNYDVIHYHGHVPNVGLYIPENINFVQTRHDQGSDCLINTRFKNGKICTETSPRACASCANVNANPAQRIISTVAVSQYRKQVAKSFQRHKTIFVSNNLKRNAARVFGDQVSSGMVVPHFVNRDGIEKARKEAANTAVQDGKFHIFIAGKLYYAKGIEPFLRELFPRIRPDMHITIAGDGPDEARLRSEFKSGQIEFLGWCSQEKTLQLAASADAIVVPSILEEAFGATTLEGILLGKPTFALAIGATPELGIYATGKDQLHLHMNMHALVNDLLSSKLHVTYPMPSTSLGGPAQVIQQLLRIYNLPPGNSVEKEKIEDLSKRFEQRVSFEQ
jgi:glycosyltransferase involved in cell wall biosynthesis